MFKDASAPIGDDLMYPLVHLFHTAKSMNITVSTIDTEPLESYDAIFFMDFPTMKNQYFKELLNMNYENLYLILFEGELIRPDNWDVKNHQYFKKVFTWNDDYVDAKKYFKFFLPNKIPIEINFDQYLRKNLCTLIASNKFVSHPKELYSKRVEAIRWFEKYHPDDFDLYGLGWNLPFFKRILSPRKKKIEDLLKFSSYNGPVDSKYETLKKYQFAICYENALDFPGYITEKIFDCFFAGCIPIYWGAPNIDKYIPSSTFIDKRNFETYQDLYDYISNMPTEEYHLYLRSIKEFVNSQKIYPFSSECFAEIIINELP